MDSQKWSSDSYPVNYCCQAARSRVVSGDMKKFIRVKYVGEPTRLGGYGEVDNGTELSLTWNDWEAVKGTTAESDFEVIEEHDDIRPKLLARDAAAQAEQSAKDETEVDEEEVEDEEDPEGEEDEEEDHDSITVEVDSYDDLTMAGLRDEIDDRELDRSGLRSKASLIELLEQDDLNNASAQASDEASDEAEGEEE